MTSNDATRPPCISPDWQRHTTGYSFACPPPPEASSDRALASPNLWDRLLCVTLRAQTGDFSHAAALLPIIEHGHSVHLRDCAIRVFAQSAPSTLVVHLADVFAHPDPDARIEAIAAAILTTDLRLCPLLTKHRSRTKGFERELTMDALSAMLEPDADDVEVIDSPLGDAEFGQKVMGLLQAVEAETGMTCGIYHGAKLDLSRIAAEIGEILGETDPFSQTGGAIHERFSLIESMTGWPFAGCLDDECAPVPDQIAHTLNSLHQSKRLDALQPGRRYFFGHELP
ncbi:MAG: hypothetical protein R6X02_10795 [Enhygromyxa sp.]